MAESFCRHYNLPRYKVLVVPNGANMVDNPKYLQECSKDILFVASMYSKQNRRAVHNLVKIFSEVVKEVTEARLIIIGGPLFLLREVIMDLAEEKRLYTKNTLMLGQVSETVKKRCLKKACICPLPYDPADGLAGGTRLKALECLAYGKIVVSTSAGIEGIDGVINGENMIIVNRLEEFKKYIIEVLNHPEKYTQMRKKALRLATKYSWDNVLPRYKDIIDSI